MHVSPTCFAHARRKFDEAIKAQGKGAKAKTGKAHQGRAFIGKPYRIEREIKDLGADERLSLLSIRPR